MWKKAGVARATCTSLLGRGSMVVPFRRQGSETVTCHLHLLPQPFLLLAVARTLSPEPDTGDTAQQHKSLLLTICLFPSIHK